MTSERQCGNDPTPTRSARRGQGEETSTMNRARDLPTELDEKKRIAAEICVRARCLTRCEVHGNVIDDGEGNPEEAHQLAKGLIGRNDPLVAAFQGNLQELKTFITAAVDEHGPECPRCAA